MENPYEKFDAHRSEVRIGHGYAWVLTFVFLLVCTLAPFWRNVQQRVLGPAGWAPIIELFRYSPESGTLVRHLRETEKKIEDADFIVPPRQWLQWFGTVAFHEGNRKTAIGSDGWLFFRPAIDALTGYGPLEPEPDTVAKDPNRRPWRGPLDAIVKFHEQVKSYGAELILAPIPVKPMIYPEQLGGGATDAPVTHRDAEKFYAALREAGVHVLDLSRDWFASKGDRQVFLKQDTHWTPQTAEASARRVADFLKKRSWFGGIAAETGQFSAGAGETVKATGDLVEKLDLPAWSAAYDEEETQIRKVTDAKGGEISIYDQDSPVVLLGDSFTNIFHQADMKWGTGAGFAEHLSRELGIGIDTIAQNGQASTGVRRTLAVRPDAEKRMREKKKAVVWAIAARDLFLSETPALENQVFWDDVEFRTGDPSQDFVWPVEFEGKVEMVSTYADPKTAPYPASLYSVEYRVERVIRGVYREDTALVFHWAFKDRMRSATANIKAGETHRVTMAPLDTRTEFKGINQSSDSARFDLVPAWAESVQTLAGGRESDTEVSEEKAARLASIATAIFSLAFGGVIWSIYRKKRALRRLARERNNGS